MRNFRFYCQTIDSECTLDAAETNHLARVLRLSEGSRIELFDGRGTMAQGVVARIGKKETAVHADTIHRHPARPGGRVILAVSFAKGQRFDWLVEKCTELGADHIAATIFERTVKLGKSSVVDRLDKIALAAVKQCGRLFVPEITGPAGLAETVQTLSSRYPEADLFWGDPEGGSFEGVLRNRSFRDAIVFIGPEGGMTDSEVRDLAHLKACPVCINPNILRVETAATAFCTLLAACRPD